MSKRAAMRLCFVAAGLLGLVGVAAPRVAAEDTFTGRPAIFSGVAAASGIHETFDRTSGLAVVAEPVWETSPTVPARSRPTTSTGGRR